jgi:hypothetical protein
MFSRAFYVFNREQVKKYEAPIRELLPEATRLAEAGPLLRWAACRVGPAPYPGTP